MPDGQLRCLSLFTGAGGLDLGFQVAGFQHVGCVERDRDARQTIAANQPDWPLLKGGDILERSPTEILNAFDIKRGELELVLAGPPCQPFSKSAFWVNGNTARLNDPRARTLQATLDLVECALPKAVVIENVRGISYRGKDEGVALIRERLDEINKKYGTEYQLTATCLRATNYGVPQLRDRTFLIAIKSGLTFSEPLPITGIEGVRPVPTAWDALSTINVSSEEREQLSATGKWADLLPSIPEGSNYLWHTPEGGGEPLFAWRSRFWSFLLKLAKDKPSWTIQANPGSATGPFHWDNRRLAIKEMARLQSFPSQYHFVGSYHSARRQIGNAVPPAMAEAVARRVRALICGEPYCGELKLAVPVSVTSPPPGMVTQVPAKYLVLKGTHKPHPGTGLGPGALRRAN